MLAGDVGRIGLLRAEEAGNRGGVDDGATSIAGIGRISCLRQSRAPEIDGEDVAPTSFTLSPIPLAPVAIPAMP
jgi:hypothetical protein